jgi:hypothetical protein
MEDKNEVCCENQVLIKYLLGEMYYALRDNNLIMPLVVQNGEKYKLLKLIKTMTRI